KFPPGSLPCFISGAVMNAAGIRTSTPLLKVEPTKLGVNATVPCPDYDGCALWGSFEDEQIVFLKRHTQSGQTRWVPQLSNDAKHGKNSAIAPAGRTL